MKINSVKTNSNQSFGMSMKVGKSLLKEGAAGHLKQLNEALDVAAVQVAVKKYKFKASAPIDNHSYRRLLKIEASPLEKDQRSILTKVIDAFKGKREKEAVVHSFNKYGKTNPDSHEIAHIINRLGEAVSDAVKYNAPESAKAREELFNSTVSKINKIW